MLLPSSLVPLSQQVGRIRVDPATSTVGMVLAPVAVSDGSVVSMVR